MQQANISNVQEIANYLYAMYMEVDKNNVKDDITLFIQLATQYIQNDIVMYDTRGFFILKDETSIVQKTKVWNGVAVYVKPEYRHTKALKDFYSCMFNIAKDGIIMGYTEVNSAHNKVLMKRHNLLGYVYSINRSKA